MNKELRQTSITVDFQGTAIMVMAFLSNERKMEKPHGIIMMGTRLSQKPM